MEVGTLAPGAPLSSSTATLPAPEGYAPPEAPITFNLDHAAADKALRDAAAQAAALRTSYQARGYTLAQAVAATQAEMSRLGVLSQPGTVVPVWRSITRQTVTEGTVTATASTRVPSRVVVTNVGTRLSTVDFTLDAPHGRVGSRLIVPGATWTRDLPAASCADASNCSNRTILVTPELHPIGLPVDSTLNHLYGPTALDISIASKVN